MSDALAGSTVARRTSVRTLSEKSSSDTGARTFFRGGGFFVSAVSASEGTRLLVGLGPSLGTVGGALGVPGLGLKRAGVFEGAGDPSVVLGVLDPDPEGLSDCSGVWSDDSAGLDEVPSFARRRRRI